MAGETMILVGCGLGALALVSAFISAVETALFSLQPSQIEAMKSRRASFAGTLVRMLEHPRRLLTTILLVDAFANVPLMVGCVAVLNAQKAVEIPFWASSLLVFALVVFVCDLVPKLVGLGAPQFVARLGVPFLRIVMPVAEPFANRLQRISQSIADAILPAGMKKQRHLTEDELETLVELSTETGALHETESEMISEIIKLGDKTARDCMTPRVDMVSLPDDLTNEEVLALVRQKRFRRVPVYGETPDDIAGVLDVGKFLRNAPAHYTDALDVPSFVPETMNAITLLKSFLSRPQGLAIVVDEHGGVEGIITLADLVEEIISDAVPQADAGLYLDSTGDGRLLANGNARLEDIGEELRVSIEEEGIDTIGGLIFNEVGQLPKPGQEIRVGGLKVTVRRVSRKRVEEVLIEREEVAE